VQAVDRRSEHSQASSASHLFCFKPRLSIRTGHPICAVRGPCAQNGCPPTCLPPSQMLGSLRNATSAPRCPSTELRGNLLSGILLHIGCGRVTCATPWPALIQDKQRRFAGTSVFLPGREPIRRRPTKIQRGAKFFGPRELLFGAMRACRGPLLHARGALKKEGVDAAATQAQHHPANPVNTTTISSARHAGLAEHLPALGSSSYSTRTTIWSRQPVSEPGDHCLSAKDSDPRIAQLVIAALITFLAYFMLRAGYS
jgi:hypothetical protein